MFTDAAAQSQSLWPILVSSSVISAAISACIAGLINLRGKRNEYVNDYYKTVIKRRIIAYEELEKFIVRLKASVVGDDNRPCHVMFVFGENTEDPRVSLVGLTAHALWLSNEVFAETRKLDILLFGLKQGNEIEFGKKNYQAIATHREALERLMAKDMLNLHDVRGFLKSKDKPDPGLSPIRLEH
jgi:hypothetical protein